LVLVRLGVAERADLDLLREETTETMTNCLAKARQEGHVGRQIEQVHARKMELAGMLPGTLEGEAAGAASWLQDQLACRQMTLYHPRTKSH
jgi:hypothetical protein